MVDVEIFREAMSRLGAAVSVVTTDGPAGKAGFTASAVCSVTDTPPTLLVCMNRDNPASETFAEGAPLCVNLLGADQQDLSNLFAGGEEMAARFVAHEWSSLTSGAPVLRQALVNFDGHIDRVVEVGTHNVLFVALQEIQLGSVRPGLGYVNRAYTELG